MDKKGIELSMNFIVTIIIAITIFFFGAKFIYNLASEAVKLEDLTTSDLDTRIGELLCGGDARVCVGIDRQTIQKGKFAVFGLKIVNVLDSQNFDILVSRPSPGGYTKSNNPIFGDTINWNPKTRSIFLKRNEERDIGIGIEVPKTTKAGTYIFDVRIAPYNEIYKFYVIVP